MEPGMYYPTDDPSSGRPYDTLNFVYAPIVSDISSVSETSSTHSYGETSQLATSRRSPATSRMEPGMYYPTDDPSSGRPYDTLNFVYAPIVSDISSVSETSSTHSYGETSQLATSRRSPATSRMEPGMYYPTDDPSSGRPYDTLNFVYAPVVSDISSASTHSYGGTSQLATSRGSPATSNSSPGTNSEFTESSSSEPNYSTLSSVSEDARSAMLASLVLRKVAPLGDTGRENVLLCEGQFNPNSKVVVKLFPPYSGRYSREAAALRHLRHPNVISLIEAVCGALCCSIVLPYYPKGSLTSQLGQLSFLTIVDYFIKISEALFYTHTQRVIHGDIKPDNILIDAESNPRIADFDLAEVLPPGECEIKARRGTPGFMAPEMILDEHGSYNGFKIDAFSLGAVLLSMLFETDMTGWEETYRLPAIAIFPAFPAADMLRYILINVMNFDSSLRWDVSRVLRCLKDHHVTLQVLFSMPNPNVFPQALQSTSTGEDSVNTTQLINLCQ